MGKLPYYFHAKGKEPRQHASIPRILKTKTKETNGKLSHFKENKKANVTQECAKRPH